MWLTAEILHYLPVVSVTYFIDTDDTMADYGMIDWSDQFGCHPQTKLTGFSRTHIETLVWSFASVC